MLSRAVHELGVPHPLHVHSSNLGLAGNVDTTLGTIRASEGLPVHLTHIQFHSYGTEGDRKFSSAAARVAEAINTTPNASCDVGQILFGQTVTASGDSMAQYRNSGLAHPKKYVVMDIECDAGCGVVPFKYRDHSFVNALQWAVGLEIFLLVNDPWRVFLTTDHPNGAPFTTYPHLIRLLMDRTFRNERLALINPEAQALTTVGSIDREYSLYEIAILTRAAPARLLGLRDLGHLGPGAVADITVYRDHPDRERMFSVPEYVFKDGEIVVRDGKVVRVTWGRYPPGAAGVRPRHRAPAQGLLRAVPDHAGRPPADHARRDARLRTRGGRRHSPLPALSPMNLNGVDDRRRVRGGLRDEGHPDPDHRPQPGVGLSRGECRDGLRHLGDRLRLRGRASSASWAGRRRPTGGRASRC